MATIEERMRILRLIENGQLTAEEGARLLGAMEDRPTTASPSQARWVRVRVTDLRSNRQKVNINIPVGLLGIGVKLGARLTAGRDSAVDLEELMQSIRRGAQGKLVDIEDLEDGERLEVFVE